MLFELLVYKLNPAHIILLALTLSQIQYYNHEVWLIIVNQYNEPISSIVNVKAIPGKAYLYNETYWLIETNASKVLVKVYRFNICVGSFELEVKKVYRLKVLVSDMIIQAPRSIVLKITLIGTNCTWTLTGEPTYILENLPHGTYQISIKGTNFIRVIYFEGGLISIGEVYNVNSEALKIILPSTVTLPIIIGIRRVVIRCRNKYHNKAKKKTSKRKVRDKKRFKKERAKKPKSLAEALLMTET